jgi:hypothetical protein
MSRAARHLVAVLGGTALLAGGAAMLPAAGSAWPSPARSGWVATWAASPMAASPQSPVAYAGFRAQTVRNVIYTSVGGDELRVQVSNAFGTKPLRIGAVSVGVVLVGAQLVPGTARTVTFGGKRSVTIPAGYRDLIRMAHARRVKIFAGTLTPFMGSNAIYKGNFGTAHGEALREAVNSWIRTSHAFDGVIDFARVIQDAYDPLYINPVYNGFDTSVNSYDNLHPNVVGYEAMAHAINLALLR